MACRLSAVRRAGQMEFVRIHAKTVLDNPDIATQHTRS
jgi:hypothetical protein